MRKHHKPNGWHLPVYIPKSFVLEETRTLPLWGGEHLTMNIYSFTRRDGLKIWRHETFTPLNGDNPDTTWHFLGVVFGNYSTLRLYVESGLHAQAKAA